MTNKNKTVEGAEDRLIKAALELFASHGFEGTSTRQICEKANINVSMIPYYFKNKEGLYKAAVETLANKIRSLMQPVLVKMTDLENKPKEELRSLLDELINHFSQIAFSLDVPQSIGVLVVREQVDPGPAFEILFNTIMKDVYGTYKKLISLLIDKPESDPEVTVRTTTIIGQVMAFRMTRTVTLRSLGKDSFEDSDVQLIRRIIKEQVNAMLDAAGGKL